MNARHSGALEAIDRILNRGGDADEVLRSVVATLRDHAALAWVGIAFFENGEYVLGPQAGDPREQGRLELPVRYGGEQIAVLRVAGARDGDTDLLERVALLISAQCLVAWDTGGETWEP